MKSINIESKRFHMKYSKDDADSKNNEDNESQKEEF